jgi:tetratricopeptide (TPR) repeat protein
MRFRITGFGWCARKTTIPSDKASQNSAKITKVLLPQIRMLALLAALLLAQSASAGTPARPTAPSAFATLSQQAAEARDAGKLDDAFRLYQRALKLRPQWDEGLWNAGSIAYDTDHYAACAPLFHRLTAIKTDLAPAWTMAGLCEYATHDYSAALKSLTRAELLHFDGPPELSRAARLHLALVLTRTGSFEKAIVLLTELTRMDKKTQDIAVAAGIAGLRKPWTPAEVPEAERERVARLGDAMSTAMELDAKGAVEKFEAALQQFPDDPDIHFRFGAFLMRQSPDRGVSEIQKTIELQPDHVPALVGLASIYLGNGDAKRAMEYAKRATQAHPEDFAPHVVYGRALLETDNYIDAAVELENAVRLAPESADAHYSLATAYARLGRKDDAQHEQDVFKRLRKSIDAAHP